MKSIHKMFTLIAVATAVFSIFSMLLMSDIGQFIALPKAWIIAYYKHAWLLGGVNLLMLGSLWFLHLSKQCGPRWLMVFATFGVTACIFAANTMNGLLFPTKQHTASYVSLAEADKILKDEQIVYVLDIDGEVRAYPQDHLELPHVAGAEFGDQKVAMTYCGLSNLPVAISQDIGTGASDFKVMAQVNNNLILRDTVTGELVQQITATTEFSGYQISTYPNTMMRWESCKQLYPEAEVFIYGFDRILDPIFMWFFAETLKIQDDPEHGAAFPTLSMEDTRLNAKEPVWGYAFGADHIAFTHQFAKQNPIYNFEFGGEPLTLVYDPEHEIITLFSRTKDGKLINFESINFRGETETVRLEQRPLYNAVYWMVWSHWFPKTELKH